MFDKLYDKGFRKSIRENPKQVMQSLGYEYGDDVEFVIKENTKSLTHIPFSAHQSKMSDEVLMGINAAGFDQASTAGTASSASTVGGSAGSVACASTHGSYTS